MAKTPHFNAGGAGSISGGVTRIPHTVQLGEEESVALKCDRLKFNRRLRDLKQVNLFGSVFLI